MFCALCRWFLFRLHESPRYLVSTGREEEALVVLRAIATFNDAEMTIQCADVQAPEEHGEDKEANVENDKKNSELPTPTSAMEMTDERAPLPQYLDGGAVNLSRASSEGSRPPSRNYDALGQGAPPNPPKRPIRMGSAFYADTSLTVDDQDNEFAQSFGNAVDHEGPSRGMNGSLARKASIKSLSSIKSARLEGAIEWWERWKKQIRKLFVPQWRRTVTLMWIIWAAMAFCELFHACLRLSELTWSF